MLRALRRENGRFSYQKDIVRYTNTTAGMNVDRLTKSSRKSKTKKLLKEGAMMAKNCRQSRKFLDGQNRLSKETRLSVEHVLGAARWRHV